MTRPTDLPPAPVPYATPDRPAARADVEYDASRHRRMRVLIALTFLLFAGLFAVLFHGWSESRQPPGLLFVNAPESLRGAVVTVAAGGDPTPYAWTIGGRSGLSTTFHLDYGYFTLSVEQDGRTRLRDTFQLNRNEPYKQLDMTKLATLADAPAAAAAAAAPDRR